LADINLELLQEMLERDGFDGSFKLTPLSGGANNRVFRVDGKFVPLLLKVYFKHPGDLRDRAATEFAFADFAWERGLRCIPQPINCDRHGYMGLYRFLSGRRVSAAEMNDHLLHQAMVFYRALNEFRDHPDAGKLPEASEACFDLLSHIRCIEQRVERLQQVHPASAIDRDAHRFVSSALLPLWTGVAETFQRQASSSGIPLDRKIDQKDRRLSPSDFGFHNALLSDDGILFFYDFEYSGWDDPAKLVCDFFCQPAIPVPRHFFDSFRDAVVSGLTNPEEHSARVSMLLPVYQVKWISIMLNDFLPASDDRRRFAGLTDDSDRKANQLAKARTHLQQIEVRA